MRTLQDELDKATSLDIEPIIERIKAESGGLEGLGKIIEEVVMPLLGSHKLAILRLAEEIDALHSPTAQEEDHGD